MFGKEFKVLKEIMLISESDAEIIVSCDDEISTFKINGSKKPQTIKILKKGKYFSVDFKSNSSGVNISNPQVIVGYLYG